jgi:hypothetical protein
MFVLTLFHKIIFNFYFKNPILKKRNIRDKRDTKKMSSARRISRIFYRNDRYLRKI